MYRFMNDRFGGSARVVIANFAALCITIAATAIADETPDGLQLPNDVEYVASVEGITEYRLKNGLRVLLFPDSSQQQITVNVTYLVGSMHEGYGETGMAHLLEHLVFKGSTNHPDITKELTERGASPNGSTWFDRTNYFETFPSSEDNLRWALDLESDRMVNSFIKKEDLDSEMTVVRNEWERAENNPFRVLRDRILASAFVWHNYGKTTIGARSDIENVPIERLKAFYKKYYQPDNAVLVVAGKFDSQFALDTTSELFGRIPQPDRTGANRLYPPYTAEPAQDGERKVTLRRVGDTQYVAVAFHTPAGSDPKYASVEVLAHVLGNQPSGRLYKNLVEKKLAAGVATYAYQLMQPGFMFSFAEVRKEGDLEASTEALLNTLEELKETNPPTAEEINRAKNEFLTNIELAYNNPRTIALQLSEWVAMGDWRLMFLHRDNIEKVTVKDVQTAAQDYLLESNRTIGRFYPTAETPPRVAIGPAPNVAELVSGYVGREAISRGEDFDPSPANIQARTTELSLANGLKVALLPKGTRGDTVEISFDFPFGSDKSLTNQYHRAMVAQTMLMRGTKERSRQAIQDELDRLKTRLAFGGEMWQVTGTMSTVREHLPGATRLLAEILQNPAFTEAEFELVIEELMAGIEVNLNDPISRAQEAYRRYLVNTAPAGHPHYYYSFEESLAALSELQLEDVKAFWRDFYGANHGALAVVGDFDAKQVTGILEETFGNWNSSSAYVHIPYEHIVQDAVSEVIETPDKSNATMYAVQNLGVYEEHLDFPAFRIGMQILGGGFLNSRLAERIRQRDGLSYGVGAQLITLAPDPTSLFLAYAIFAPENRELIVQAFQEEVALLLKDGIPQEELDAAVRGYLDLRQNLRANDRNVASILASNLRHGRTMTFIENIESNIAVLTPSMVQEALQQHLPSDRIAIFRAGDFANTPVAQ